MGAALPQQRCDREYEGQSTTKVEVTTSALLLSVTWFAEMACADSNGADNPPARFLKAALSTLQAVDEHLKKIKSQVGSTQERLRKDVEQAVVSKWTLAKQCSRRLGPALASLHAPGGSVSAPNGALREDESLLSASRVESRPSGKVSGSLWGPRGGRAKGDDQPAKENAPYASFSTGGAKCVVLCMLSVLVVPHLMTDHLWRCGV